jgi:hypothetical protein
VWAAGGVALVGGYIYLRSKGKAAGQQSAAGATTQAVSGSPTGLSWEQFLLFIHDQQSSPAAAPKPAPAPKPAAKPAGPKMYWSGDLGRWMTGQQWHQWHVAHVAHEQHLAGGK